MRERTAAHVVAGIGLGFLVLPVLPLLWRDGVARTREAPPFVASGSRARASRRSPTDQALREAVIWEVRARQAAHEGCEARGAWEPEPLTGADGETDRHRLASDVGGYLRRARRVVLRAAKLARTPDEARRAAELLVRLECEAGQHRAELRQARRLVALAPRDPHSWCVLRRALRCNSRTPAEGESRRGSPTWR